jgi:hypothetical protein
VRFPPVDKRGKKRADIERALQQQPVLFRAVSITAAWARMAVV